MLDLFSEKVISGAMQFGSDQEIIETDERLEDNVLMLQDYIWRRKGSV